MEKETPFFRTEYNYDMNAVSEATALHCPEPSKTRQEFADDANINVIVERFGIGHEMPLNTRPPMSGDFTNLPDYKTALDMIRAADDVFGSLPAKIRARFNNDPAQYIDFLEDPENEDEAVKLGLATKAPIVQDPPKGVTPQDPPKTA